MAERRGQSLSSTARVLVASDNQDDAAEVAGLLRSEFGDVSESTDPERDVEDFEAFEPHVLVLAFETIEKAQSYALGLYRFSRKVSAHAHRTVVLCNKDQVRMAFALCKKGSFDDYVLYWPHAQDGLRLTMSVLSALRQLSATVVRGPSHVELVSHVRQVSAIQSVIDEQLKAAGATVSCGKRIPQSGRGHHPCWDRRAVRTARRSRRDGHRRREGPARPRARVRSIKARPCFPSLQVDRVGGRTCDRQAGVDFVTSSLRIAALASLGEKIGKTRPVVMLVDDDDVMQLLVAGALDRTPYDPRIGPGCDCRGVSSTSPAV